MKKVYSYDYNGKYIGEVEAELCQITELLKLQQKEDETPIESVYVIPAYCTTIEPYFNPSVEDAFFIDGEWQLEEIKPEIKPEVEPPHVPDYKELRAKEYPAMVDYMDGLVKGDAYQMKKYVDDCLAVKAKYPKV